MGPHERTVWRVCPGYDERQQVTEGRWATCETCGENFRA